SGVDDSAGPAIGIDDNFFRLGGHSLRGAVLASRIHKAFQVKVPLTRLFASPTIRGLARYIKETKPQEYASIEPAETRDYYPLTPAQKRLFILQQMETHHTGYNMPRFIPFGVGQAPDKGKLESIFKVLIARHESLRTSFHLVNDEPMQRVHGDVAFRVEDREPGMLNEEPFVRPFDLSQTPLLRVGLGTTKDGRGLLMIDVHHIISDGVSRSLLEREWSVLYSGGELPELRVQYKDYALWLADEPQQAAVSKQETYWLNRFTLDDAIPVLELPRDYPRPMVQSFDGSAVDFILNEEETRALKTPVERTHATLYMTILAVFNVLLSKLAGQEDIIVGSPVAGRPHDDLQQVMGMFVNTLAVRNYPSGEKTFAQLLAEVKTTGTAAFENQEYPFEDLVDRLSLARDTGRNPLFDVMFNLLNQSDYTGDLPTIGKSGGDTYKHREEPAKFDLTLTAIEVGEGVHFTLNYCKKLFMHGTVERIITYFRKLTALLPANPDQPLSGIEIITEPEKQQILQQFNDTRAQYPENKTIHGLFEEQVARNPESTALIGRNTNQSDVPVTYGELNQRADGIGRLLIEKGVETGSIVALMMERSLEMVIAIFGILKAGAAYLPIDPRYPEERIRFMLADSNAIFCISDDSEKGKNNDQLSMINIQLLMKPSALSAPSAVKSEPANPAYIIYTSGTTGKPKGVLVEHRSVVNLLDDLHKTYPFSERDTYLFKTSYIFDVSVSELFGWYTGGGRLALLDAGAEKEPLRIIDAIEHYTVSHVNFVPSMFTVFADTLDDENIGKLSELRYIFLAGEALQPALVKAFNTFNSHVKLENLYGPTEATVYAGKYSLSHWGGESSVPIGRPLQNTDLYILDRYGHLQPIGITGELCIGGTGVARGYLNRPGLTNEKFEVRSSKCEVYHTGDLARWLPDGNIQFLGRKDHQVKVRGFRIELGEIENRLLEHEHINETVVIANQREDGDQFLSAYVVGEELPQPQLRQWLSKELPEYMIPSYFVPIETIPLTPSGKVDRSALPHPEVTTGEDHVAPTNEMEEQLTEIWSIVLGIPGDSISTAANFFHLGGHSLKATILATKIRQRFNVNTPLAEIFNKPDIRRLARWIEAQRRDTHEPAATDDRLVLLKKGTEEGERLFFIHDGSGEVEGYMEFCNHLDPSRGYHCWGIRSDSIAGYAPRDLTIEAIASGYIETVKTLQPTGPYRIVGWSLGGTIAFEMVRQLEQAGEEIGWFGMIDVAPPRETPADKTGSFTIQSESNVFKEYLPREFSQSPGETDDLESLWTSIVQYLETHPAQAETIRQMVMSTAGAVIPNARHLDIGSLIRYFNRLRSFDAARSRYIPQRNYKLETTPVYIGASQSKERIKHQQWNRYCREPLTFREIEGDHHSIFTFPRVAELSSEFEKQISR
ncbi:MAG: amino acid adenylation domain-containing protein, partial [bacterium]|nr:amino acid adenylation domain-containing protein [bacterium]